MPSQVVTSSGAPWSVEVLPYVEQDARFRTFDPAGGYAGLFDFDPAWSQADSAASEKARQMTRNPLYECPSNPLHSAAGYGTSYLAVQGGGVHQVPGVDLVWPNEPTSGVFIPDSSTEPRYTSSNGLMYPNSKVKFASIGDGLSNTALLAESRYTNSTGAVGSQFQVS